MAIDTVWSFVSDALPALATAASVAAGLGVLWLRQHFTPRADHVRLAQRVGAVERDVAAVQGCLQHVPSVSDLETLRLDIKAVQGSQEAFNAKIDGLMLVITAMQTDSQMIKEHLMDGGR